MWTDLIFKKKSTGNLQIDSLDGLRGLAVIFVILSHLSRAKLHVLPFLDLRGLGHSGVYLFFVLSAFLLTLPLLSDKTDLFSARLWLNYTVRRFFRIYPLFIVALLVKHYVIIYHLGVHIPTDALIKEIAGHLTLQIGRGIFWTIAVEFKFYLILPLIAFIFVRVFKKNFLYCALAVAAAIIVSLVIYPPGAAFENTQLVPFLPIFLPGTLAALAYTKLKKSGVVERFGLGMEALALAAFLIVVMTMPSFLTLVTGRYFAPGFFHGAFLPCGLLWSVFAVSYLNGRGWLEKVLASTVLRFLGLISFGIYVWHMVAINLVLKYVEAGDGVKIILVVVTTVVLSSVTYMVIERPFMKIRIKKRA